MAGGIDWFRWHHGSVTDPKFQLVARKAGVRLPDVLAVWAFVLEKASASDERGNFGVVDFEAVDCLFGLDDGQTALILEQMGVRGLVQEGRIVAWEKRQPKRERDDPGATDRKRHQRARDATSANQDTPLAADESHVTPCHATSHQKTPREEKRREENTKSNTPPLSPPGGGASSPQFSETDQNGPGAIGEPSGYLPLTLPAIVLPAPEHGPSRAVSDAGQIKQKRKVAGLSVGVVVMVEAGMQPETAELFSAHKARLRAPLTPLAWAAHLRESAKAGITPEAAAIIVMERGWKGFQAEYVAGKAHSGAPGRANAGLDEPEWRREQRERNEAFFGPFAAKRRPETIEAEVRDAAPDFLG
jgi:hypothetical protein